MVLLYVLLQIYAQEWDCWIKLNEVSYTDKDKRHMMPLICGI